MKRYKNPPAENSEWFIEGPYGKERARFCGVMPNGSHSWAVDGGTLFLPPTTPREPVEEIQEWAIAVFDIEGRLLGYVSNDDAKEFDIVKAVNIGWCTYLTIEIALEKIDYLRQGQPTYQYVAKRVK